MIFSRVNCPYLRAVRQHDQPPPLRWDGKRLAGTVDVWVLAHDQVNHWGLAPSKSIRAFRVGISTTVDKEGRLRGSYQAKLYQEQDRTYGKDAPKFKGSLEGRWLGEFWRACRSQSYPRFFRDLQAPWDWPRNNFPISEGDSPIFAARKSGQFPSYSSAAP